MTAATRMGGLTATALVVAGGVVAVAVLPQDGGLAYRDMPAAGVKVATALFVVALFLERGLAVLNGLLFPDGEVQERRVFDPAVTGKALDDARKALARVEAGKAQVRLAVGFVFALAVAMAGARTLEGLMEPPTIKDQLTLFKGVDIVLTAGLLAGGSEGLALILAALKKMGQEFMAERRARIRAANATFN